MEAGTAKGACVEEMEDGTSKGARLRKTIIRCLGQLILQDLKKVERYVPHVSYTLLCLKL